MFLSSVIANEPPTSTLSPFSSGGRFQWSKRPVDTSTSAGKAFLDMLGVFAEFETNLRKERQMEGISSAKERGVYKGRKISINRDKVNELRSLGMGATSIARELGIGRASVYRCLS